MKRGLRLFTFIVLVAFTTLAPSPLLAGMGGGMTTADLALQLVRAAGISPAASGTPQAALDSLRRAGIDLGSDLKAPVTEKVLAQVALALGVGVSTSRPDAVVTPAVASAFVASVKGALRGAAEASGRGGSDAVNASCQGRESREGRKGTPASPADFNATAGPCEDPAP